MIWRSATGANIYGVATNSFVQEDKPHRLSLDVGDAVIILKETTNWYYGYKHRNSDEMGIFPKTYIHLCECVIKKNEYVIKRTGIVEEITSVLREWGTILKKFYLTRHDKFHIVRQKLLQLIYLRSLLLSGNLPLDEMRRVKLMATSEIDTGNSILGLDMVVRDDLGDILNINTVCTTQLYEYHVHAAARIKKAFSPQNHIKPTRCINKHSHNLLLSVHAFICKIQEDSDLLFTLYDNERQRPLTENYVLKWSRQGINRDLESFNNNRVLFTDLSSDDLNSSKIYLVCFAVKISQTDVDSRNSSSSFISTPNKKLSQISHNSNSTGTGEKIRKPLGVAAIDLTPVLKKPEDFKNNLDLPFTLCEKENLDTTLKRLISNKDISKIDSKLAVSVEVLHGDMKQIKEEYPHILRGNILIARKMGFPEIIFPGDVRNDLYLTLVSGEFSKGIKNSDKNIEVTIAVYNDKGIMVPEVISLGVGLPSVSEYKSIVYYHEDKPRWMETFKVHVSVEEFKRCHLKFTLKHRRSNEQKDKIEKPFALAYIPLMQLNGTTIQQGYHKLNIFKIDYKKYDKDDPLAYIDLSFKGGDMSGNNKLSALGLSLTTKDYLIIDSNLCSTKLTEDVTLLGVLNWTSRKDNLEAALKHLNMVAESEVVKFLQDILDALFNILVQNNDPEKYNPLVFMCLIRLIEIVHDRKYEHFQSVLNLYISESFCATLAYEKLIKVLGDQIIDATRQQDGMNSATNEIDGDKTPSERLFKTTKQIHYIIKFIVKSRILFADLNDNSGFEEFEKSIEDLLQLFTNMIACRNDLLKPEGALLKYLHIIASDLMEVYDCIKLSHNIVDIITRFPPGRLTQSKMACIKDFIDSKLFHIPKCREVLLPVFCKQIKDRLESKEEGDSKTDIWQQEKNLMKAAKVLGELKSQLHSRETTVKSKISECVVIMNNILKLIFRPDVGQVENDIIEIVLKLLRTIIQTSIAMDRDNPLVGNLVAIMLGIFHSMSTKHYEIYVESFNTKYDLQDFLTEILLVFKDLVSKPVFPSDWMDMIMHQNTVILESLRQLSLIVIKKFFNQFEKQVWSNFFQCSIAFLIQQPLQLELFSEEKHLTIRSKYKDIRRLTAIEIQKMWFQLGEYKNQFIPQLVGPILEMSMIPEIELRKTTIPIFFDMMQCEYYSSRYITESYGDTKRNNTHYKANFNEFETEMIEKLDILVTAGRGDYEYKEIFYELMSQLCSSHNTLNTKGLNFVNIVTKLLERLLEYRCIIHDESIENKMACTVSLLQFYSEVNRKEMYIRYVYKLCDLHMEFDNYTEAAFTLQLHSNLLSWDDIELIPIFKSNRHINCRTHRQLKEALYYDIIHYFEKGKMWECAIDMCKQLAIQYEHETFNYLSLSAIYKKIAEFFENILKKMRHDCEYFRVAFYGLKFPEFLRNKVFVYRGKEYERLSDFCTRILMQHPSAELMQTLTVPGKEITHSEAQFIQINNIEPIMEEKYQKFNSSTAISKEIIKYYRTNNVQKFRFSRNLDSKGADSGVDNIWLERTIMKTSFPLPGILRWFPVISTEKIKISPIQHAIETMENTNNALRDLIIAHKMDEDLPINQLSMKINGIVDPAVMGGSGKYEQAFLIPEYLEKNPEHKDLVIKLKDLIASQIPLLEIALSVHRLKTPPSLILFHERLENCFTELQTNIESKYGKRTCDLKINHDDYVVLRRGKTIAQGSSDCNNRLSETSNTSSDSGRVKSTHGNRSQTNSIKSTLVNFNFNTVTLNRTSSNSSTGLKNKNKNKAEKRRSYKKFDRETVPPPVSNSQWYTLATGPTIINSMLSEDSLRSLYDGTPNTSLLYELREQLTPKRPLRSEAEKERRLSRPTSVSSQNFNMQELETSAPSLVTKECDDIYSLEKEENSVRPPLPSKLRDSSDLTNCNLQQNISSIEEQLFTEKDDKKRPPTPPPKPNRNSRCTSSL